MRHGKLGAGIVLVVGLVVLLTACGGPATTGGAVPVEPGRTGSEVNLDGTEWVLASLHGSDLMEGTNITLGFADGHASGFAGCNAYGGAYTVAEDGTLSVPVMAVTAQGCVEPDGVMEQEAAYTQVLQTGGAYRVVDDRLELQSVIGETVLVFRQRVEVAMNPSDLVGTAWQLVSTNGQPPVEGTTITLAFQDETHASGHAGCREYAATYEASGDHIRFPSLSMSGDDACLLEEAVYQQEGQYTDALTWTTNYRLEDGLLEIVTARGEVLIFEPLPATALQRQPRPSPSAAVPGAEASTPGPLPATVASTTTTATTIAPGWTRYDSINQVYDLAFAPDGALWAITGGGLVQWDLSTETYSRYLIDASRMAVAPDSTLWLGTEGGLCHFDGDTCEIYSDPNWAVQGGIRDVEVTSDRVVWMSAEGRVSRYDGKSWKSFPFYDSPLDLAVAANGEVWGAIPDGIAHYLPDQDAWFLDTAEQGLPNGSPQVIAVAPHGELWVSMAWEGLYRYDGTAWQAVAEPPGGYVGAIAFSAGGTPWVGTVGSLHYPGGNLAHWDGASWTDVSVRAGLISIRAVAVGPGDLVAAATHLGLGIYQDGQWRLLKDGPASDRVTSLAVTPDGAAWFAAGDESLSTEGSGLSRFDGQAWEYHLWDAEVGALAVAPDGSLWAGTGSAVQRYDGNAWKVMGRGQEDLPLGNVLDIAFTSDGAAWVATGFGLAKFDGTSWTIHDKLVHSIEAAPDGAIWASGWEGTQDSDYLAHFDGAEWTTYRQADSFPGRFTMGAVTPDGLIWGTVPGRGLASFDGRSWSDEGSWSFYTPASALSLENMHILGVAPDGALWLRLEGGVARFAPAAQSAEGNPADAWAFYAPEQGLSNGRISAIAFGPEGEIWLDTTRFRPAQAGEMLPEP